MKHKKLTQSARGRNCQVRIYPYCNGNPETVVFAHAPSELKGMGIKSPDWWGAYACSTCHDLIDGRAHAPDVDKVELFELHIRGVFRTQSIMIKEGLIKI